MTDFGTCGSPAILDLIARLRAGTLTRPNTDAAVRVLRVHGSPLSGKSALAEQALMPDDAAARAEVRTGSALIISSHRTAADALSDRLVRALGTTKEQRPAKTMPALAFRLLRESRKAAGLSEPKLLNGAEQDAAISAILNRHLDHLLAGDECPTCDMLRHYLAIRAAQETGQERAAGTAQGDPASGGASASDPADSSSDSVRQETTADAVQSLMTPAFTTEIRDMFARLDELSLDRSALDAAEDDPAASGRQADEWDLAFALHEEYLQQIKSDDASARYRVDSSAILVQACREVEGDRVPEGRVPSFIVVDDCQDLTVAGYSLLRALEQAGTRLVLIGGDDESVQTFRGAYPEALSALETAALSKGGMGAATVQLEQKLDGIDGPDPQADDPDGSDDSSSDPGDPRPDSYRLIVASRLSRSIGSVLAPSDVPIPRRPGKLAADQDDSAQAATDGTLSGRLFRSADEENEDLIWQIRRLVGGKEADFNDFAVIAHDNSILRTAGHALEQQGIPVSYSSVTRPLKEIPVVRGLLGLMELSSQMQGILHEQEAPSFETEAQKRGSGAEQPKQDEDRIDPPAAAALIWRILATPLFEVRPENADPRPVRLEKLTSAFEALSALSAIAAPEGQDRFVRIRAEAARLRSVSGPDEDSDSDDADADAVSDIDSDTDDSDHDDGADAAEASDAPADSADPSSASLRVRPEELIVLLLTGSKQARGQIASMLASLTASRWQYRIARAAQEAEAEAVRGNGQGDDQGDSNRPALHDPDCDQLLRLLRIVRGCAGKAIHAGRLSSGIHARLWDVWQAVGVADSWQAEAVEPTARGRAVNEWLDAIIRLFAHAQQAPAGQKVDQFLATIRGLEIEADSLASVAPRPNAVTLATPAGAAALHKKYVRLLSVEDGSWPNLSPRDALFDGQTLSQIVVRARLADAGALPRAMEEAIGRAGSSARSSENDAQAILAQQDRDQQHNLLYSEMKGFLVALTRAGSRTVISAISNDENRPSDLLLFYLPEIFSRTGLTADDGSTYVAEGIRYSRVGRDPSAADGKLPWLGGLDSDPSGMASAARLMLSAALSERLDIEQELDRIRTGRNAGDLDMEAASSASDATEEQLLERRDRVQQRIDDAAEALRVLAAKDVDGADPASWAFAASSEKMEEADRRRREDIAREGFDVTAAKNAGLLRESSGTPATAMAREPMRASNPPHDDAVSCDAPSRDAGSKPPVIPLSPSAVDSIWSCPLCWSLENRFSGPQPTNATLLFGSLIHKVAELATTDGVDRMGLSYPQMRKELGQYLRRLLADLPEFADADEEYRLHSDIASAGRMLDRMAAYFVEGKDPGYGENVTSKGITTFDGAGGLQEARAEVPFTAFFGVHEIGEYLRRTKGFGKVSDHELFEALSWLAGGFPEGTREDLRIRLSARIDRLERRGTSTWDILDWKTGHTPLRTFSDLQLVCYQLGLAFSKVAGTRPQVDRAVLFQLALEDAPAESHGIAELDYQPPLFVDGRLNDAFEARPYYKRVAKAVRESFGQMDASFFVDQMPTLYPALKSTTDSAYGPNSGADPQTSMNLLPWTLSMISRVFYAAACLQTGIYPSRHGNDHSRYKGICPQFPIDSTTVYGRLHADRPVLGSDGRLISEEAAEEAAEKAAEEMEER